MTPFGACCLDLTHCMYILPKNKKNHKQNIELQVIMCVLKSLRVTPSSAYTAIAKQTNKKLTDRIRHFSKENIQTANKNLKKSCVIFH